MKAPTGTSQDSITPSAINSWIGEEVRPVAAEGTLAADARRAQAARDRGDHGRERHRRARC